MKTSPNNFFFGKVFIAWLLIAAFYAAAEKGMRLRHAAKHGERGPRMVIDDLIEGRYLIPNTDRKSKTGSISINEHGYRGHSFEQVPPEGTLRFVILGDSTTWGGTTDETTFPACLEKVLNRRYESNPPIEVVNAGIVGLGASSMRVHLERRIVKIKPQYLLIYPAANDFYTIMSGSSITGKSADSFFGKFNVRLWRYRRSTFYNVFLDKVKQLGISPQAEAVKFVPFPKHGKTFFQEEYSKLIETALQLDIQPIMLAHSYLIRSKQTHEEAQHFLKGHFFQLGAQGALDGITAQNNIAREVAEKHNCLFLDTENSVPANREFFDIDALHFNDKGNEMFAEDLAKKLEQAGVIKPKLSSK
ncbi:MAG: SGNH/GDSL hydrolase family protein [Planctomycetaceae bacterium]|nr:SGNH/GDSL hydrolase family protein [Planctomycetaceae bacterium]